MGLIIACSTQLFIKLISKLRVHFNMVRAILSRDERIPTPRNCIYKILTFFKFVNFNFNSSSKTISQSDSMKYAMHLYKQLHIASSSMIIYEFSLNMNIRTTPGLNSLAVAQLFVQLMERIGYKEFYAQGGDWGSAITTDIATAFPDRSEMVTFLISKICFFLFLDRPDFFNKQLIFSGSAGWIFFFINGLFVSGSVG